MPKPLRGLNQRFPSFSPALFFSFSFRSQRHCAVKSTRVRTRRITPSILPLRAPDSPPHSPCRLNGAFPGNILRRLTRWHAHPKARRPRGRTQIFGATCCNQGFSPEAELRRGSASSSSSSSSSTSFDAQARRYQLFYLRGGGRRRKRLACTCHMCAVLGKRLKKVAALFEDFGACEVFLSNLAEILRSQCPSTLCIYGI
jgi:hypothetical protein